MKKLIATICLISVALVALFAGGNSEKAHDGNGGLIMFRYAENQAYDYPTTQAAFQFARMVEERTDGRIKIKVYYGAQLGDEKLVIEQMQFGAIDFARVSLSPLSEFNPSLNILQLPYLYRNGEHMWKVLDGPIGDEFLASMAAYDLVGLSWFDAGARSFYTTGKSIESLSDMKRLKIRVQEAQQMIDMVTALGATPSPMSFGDVYSGLQTGSIDGAENNWPSYDSTRHYEVAKYFLQDEHTRVPEMQIASAMTWSKLSPSDQAIIKQAAQESAEIERALWAEKEKASEEKVKKSGVVVTYLSQEEKQKFQDAMEPLYKKYGEGNQAIITRIQETK